MQKIRAFLGGKGRPVAVVLSLLPAVFAAVLALYYIWGPSHGYFHSDCTDNLLWADVSVDTGKVFDETFRYAGMLPFSATIWMIPLVKIFGVSMTAQDIGMSVFAILYICSVIYCCRSAKIGWGWSSLAAFISVCAMSASDKLREIMYGHNIYYSIGPVILFFGLGLLLRTSSIYNEAEKGEKKAVVKYSLLAAAFTLLCAGAATDGGQVIVIGSLPAVAGFCAERFFSKNERLISKKNTFLPGSLMLFALGTLIGNRLLARWKGDIDCGYANAYSGWSEVGAWADNARAFVKQYFTLIGVSPSGNLFDKTSLGPMIRILGGVVLIAMPVAAFFIYKKLSAGTKAVLWGHAVVFCAVMFGFICGKLSGANWRLTPILASASVLCVLIVRDLICGDGKDRKKEKAPGADEDETGEKEKKEPKVPARTGALFLAAILLFSFAVSFEIIKMPADYGRDNYKHQLAAFLEEQGLEYGYATFWQSQAVTALSGSKVKAREILCDKTRGVWSDHYQSSTRWYAGQEYDKYFVLLTDSEYATVANTASWQRWTADLLIKEYTADDGLFRGFRVFVFSSNILDGEVR